ncbi:MAG: hypothetical protein ABIT01_09025 [Thermoanaerobaculia bacterium]
MADRPVPLGALEALALKSAPAIAVAGLSELLTLRAVRIAPLALLLFGLGRGTLRAETVPIDFEPKVGVTGARVTVALRRPAGARVFLGEKAVAIVDERLDGLTFLVPERATTSFLTFGREDRVIARSSVPLIVTGRTLVLPKLANLRDRIDVLAYSDETPRGGERPEPGPHPFLSLDDQGIFTIGERSPEFFAPAVELSDAASAATRPMTGTFLILTARLPGKRLRLRLPPPVPLVSPASPEPVPADEGGAPAP